MAEQIATDLIPDVTGRDIGSPIQRFDAFIRNLDVTGTVTGVTFPNLVDSANAKYADDYATGSTTGGISEAIAALGSGGGVVFIPANYTANVSSTIAINKDGIVIRGFGLTSKINVTGTGDLFQVSAALFCLEDMQISVGTSSSRTGSAIIHVTAAAGAQGYVNNIRCQGDATTVDNGVFFLNNTPGAGLWFGENLRIINSGAPWTAFVKLVSAGPSSIASNAFARLVSGSKWTDAAIVIDGYIDTLKFVECDIAAPAGTAGPAIWCRNTVGAGTNPRWIHFTDVSVEAAGQTAIVLDNSRDFRYLGGYISGANKAVAIGVNARTTDISNVAISFIQNQAITTSQFASHTRISGNWFDDIGIATTNTYNGIEIGASCLDFSIIGNHFRIFSSANVMKNGIAVLAGSSNRYVISNNDIPASTTGTSVLSDLGTGVDKTIWGNQPSVSNIISASITQLGIASQAVAPANAGRLYYDLATNKYRVSENGSSYSNLRSSSVEVLDSTEVAVNTSTTSDQHLKTFILDPAGSGAMNYVGACLYVYAIGEYNTGAAAPDVTMKLAIAGVATLVANIPLTLQNSVSGQDWEFEARVYRRTTGTTGGGFGGGRITMDGLAVAAAVKLDTRTANWDDTIVQTLRLSVNFSVADSVNLWRIRHWEIRRLA